MSIASNLNDSLDELLKQSSTGNARVHRRPGKVKPGQESAMSLLDSILDDSNKAAAEEERRQEEARIRAAEEAAEAKEREALQKRLDGEMLLLKEQQEQEILRKNQAKLAKQVQREKDIEAGLIDVEEEARLAREAEEKKRAEEELRARKAQEKKERREHIAKQKQELQTFAHLEAIEAAKPKKSKAPIFIALGAAVILVAGIITFLLLTKEEIDIYAPSPAYETMNVYFQKDKLVMLAMGSNVVMQEAPVVAPKPSSTKRKSSASSASAPAPAQPKASLSDKGKGGLLGKGKSGLGRL